jgi:superfamily II DNA/RNA helicase
VEAIDQKVCLVFREQKVKLLKHLLAERKDYDSILIFSSTKREVTEIVTALYNYGFPARGISSDLDQDKREEVMGKFRAKRIRILVATNIMSRGIDVKEINLVINYDLPHDAEDYVHRIGRTARVNAKGEAITLVTQKEMHKLKKIEQLIGAAIPRLQPPDEIGAVPKWEDPGPKSDRKPKFHPRRKSPRRRRFPAE